MKKFYDISVAQLFILWVFGATATILCMEKASYAPYGSGITLAELLSWLIPLLLLFYTVGWYERRKK